MESNSYRETARITANSASEGTKGLPVNFGTNYDLGYIYALCAISYSLDNVADAIRELKGEK